MIKGNTLRIKILFFIVFSILVSARGVESKAQSSQVNISAKIAANKKQKGDALIHTEPGKFKLYASYSKNKLTGIYALGNDGKRVEATYENKSLNNDGVACAVCVIVNGQTTCYEISCDDAPAPKAEKIP